MEISVVIATRSRAALLERTLEALAAQDFRRADFEVLVAVDGPDLDTEEVLQRFAGRFARLDWTASQVPRGPAAARNRALKTARGRLVAITDDDCIPSPGWLLAIWSRFEQESGLGGLIGRTITDRTQLTPFSHFVENLQGYTHQTCNIAYPREVLEGVGCFDEQFVFSHEDTDLFSRVQKIATIGFEPKAVVAHPPRELTIFGYALSARRFEGDFIFFKKHRELYLRRHQGRTPVRSLVWDVGIKHVLKEAARQLVWLPRQPYVYMRFLLALALFDVILITQIPRFWWRHQGRPSLFGDELGREISL